MFKKFICALFFVVLITACSTVSPTVELSTTKTPVPTIYSTTMPSPAPSQTLVPTATPDPAQEILGSETRCVQKRQGQDFARFAGKFLMMDEGWRGFAMLDFRDRQRHSLFEDFPDVSFVDVSPDHRHVFAFDCTFTIDKTECSNILGEAGKTLKIIKADSNQDHWQRTRWLDNERVLAWSDLPSTPLVVFNPFTGEESSPPTYFSNTFLYPIQTSAITINSSLKTVIYFTKVGKDRLVMWNVDKKSVITEIPFLFEDGEIGYWEDNWSPDQNKFLVVSAGEQLDNTKKELYLLKIDGTVQQLTHFGNYYSTVNITYPVWSPDGRYVAFRLETSNEPVAKYYDMEDHLMLLEIASQKLYNLCVESNSFPVWSPDSQTITIGTYNKTLGNSIVFVNLEENTIQLISKKSDSSESPAAWIVLP
jgi:hypothetical protein